MKKILIATMMTLATTLSAADIKPAIVYDFGGKNDGSFNEGTLNGVTKFGKDYNIEIKDFETNNEAQFAQIHRKFAQKRFNPVLAVGFSQAQALESVAKEFPKTQFGIMDAVVDQPNVQSIVFKEQEGSFLVGVLAAMKSKTNAIGFIGGMDIPLIKAFSCGFKQGAKFINPDIKFIENMTGTTGEAWNNPVRGAQLANKQMDQGADIVFTAAGQTGRGVIAAMAKAKKLVIGADKNQNGIEPGFVLTSMLKKVNIASYKFLEGVKNANGEIKGGVLNLGLAEGGVDWALDEHNRDLITPEMEKTANLVKQLIIDGKLKVHDYRTTNSCEVGKAKLTDFNM